MFCSNVNLIRLALNRKTRTRFFLSYINKNYGLISVVVVDNANVVIPLELLKPLLTCRSRALKYHRN